MIVHFLKEDCLAALKANIPGHLRLYQEPANDWVYEFFGGENPFAPFKLPVGDFQFALAEDEKTRASLDVENAIRLYGAMKDLTNAQAADERFWAGLCHGDFWAYMHSRWAGAMATKNPKTTVAWRYFFNTRESSARRGMFMNALSRLWWWGRLTYDESRQDPFELTRIINNFDGDMLVMFSRNYTNNPVITRGLLSALAALEQDGYQMEGGKTAVLYEASQYLNIYGGTHILDYFTEEEIRQKVLDHMHRLKRT